MRPLTLLGPALLLISATGIAAHQDEVGRLLRLRTHVGEKFTYKTTNDFSMSMMGVETEMNMALDLEMETIKKDDEGFHFKTVSRNVKVEEKSGLLEKEQLDKIVADTTAQVTMIVMDERAQVKSMKVEGGTGPQQAQNSFFPQAYPEKPVKLGDTWSIDIDLRAVMAAQMPGTELQIDKPLSATITVEKFEKAGNLDLIHLRVKTDGKSNITFESPQGAMTMSMEIVAEALQAVDLANGMIYTSRGTAKTKALMMGDMEMRQTMRMTMSRS